MKRALLLVSFVGIALAASTAAGEMTVDERMQFANGLYLRGMYDMAAREYESLLADETAFPERDSAVFRLGECCRKTGRRADAVRLFEQVQETDSEHAAKAALRLAEMMIDDGRYADAATRLKDLIASGAGEDVDPAARYYLAHSLAKQDKPTVAARVYEELIAKHETSPFSAYARMELASLYRDDDRLQDALDLYKGAAEHAPTDRVKAESWFQLGETAYALGRFKDSAEAYAALFSDFPDDARAEESKLQAAGAYYQVGWYDRALAMAGEGLRGISDKEAEWLYIKANCERRLERDKDAMKTYDLLIDEHADHALAQAARYERALIEFRSGDYDKVVAELGGTARRGEVEEEISWLLAESYRELGNTAQAEQFYRRLIDESPDSKHIPQALFRLARLLRARSEIAEAGVRYRKLAEAYPEHELSARAMYEAAYCSLELGDLETAIDDWSRVVQLYPRSSFAEESLYQKALAEIRSGEQSRALKTFTALTGRFPGTPYRAESCYWMGVLEDEGGNIETSEKHLREALSLEPDAVWKPRILYRLAAVLQKQGRLDEAAGMLQQVVDSGGHADVPAALLEWLARYQVEHQAWKEAAAAANALVTSAPSDAWRQIGAALRGDALRQAGDLKKARVAYKLALQQKAKTREGAEAALHLGFLEIESGQPDAAFKAFEQAADRATGDSMLDIRAQSYYGLARVEEARGKWDEASRYYLSVGILFDEENLVSEALFRAAEALRKSGKTDQAEKTAAELKERYPDSAWARGEKPAGKDL